MLIPTHLAAVYLLSKGYCEGLGGLCGSESVFTTVSIIGALLPDIDIFFGKKVNEHRNTIFHTPIFWIIVLILLKIYRFFNRSLTPYIIAIGLGVFSHLFLDWLSGRTTGIRLLYPASKKQYSLFPTDPKIGNVEILPNKRNKKRYLRWMVNYFNNRFLVGVEILIYFGVILILFFGNRK
ncbi:metal-dependent hydrolase [Patescibacteria group bacterium]|nr:metal-dependent hydrolase [Patescibacteria group bacterium]